MNSIGRTNGCKPRQYSAFEQSKKRGLLAPCCIARYLFTGLHGPLAAAQHKTGMSWLMSSDKVRQ